MASLWKLMTISGSGRSACRLNSDRLVKYYLDLFKEEQKERLKEQRDDPPSQWKSSPIDAVALKHWEQCSGRAQRDAHAHHTMVVPWTICQGGR
jgi:polyphosphate kinase 2 (PPK2 family)